MITKHNKWTSKTLIRFSEHSGIKQIDLARHLNVRTGTVSNWFKVDQNDGKGFNFSTIHCLALDRLLELNDPDGSLKKKIF